MRSRSAKALTKPATIALAFTPVAVSGIAAVGMGISEMNSLPPKWADTSRDQPQSRGQIRGLTHPSPCPSAAVLLSGRSR